MYVCMYACMYVCNGHGQIFSNLALAPYFISSKILAWCLQIVPIENYLR